MNSKSSGNFLGRVNSDIMHILLPIMREKFANVEVISVDCAPDLSNAKVFVNIITPELEKASGFLRNELAQNLKIRRVPTLRFIVDNGGENAARVEEILRKINGTQNRI